MWREDFKCHRGGFRSSQHNYPVYAVTIQEKVALENRVNNISREADYVVDRIDDIAKEIRRCSRCCYCCCLCIQEIAETERGFSE